MCNRYCIREPANLGLQPAFQHSAARLGPRYNVAPDDAVPIIFDDSPQSLDTAIWGLRWLAEQSAPPLRSRHELRVQEALAFPETRALFKLHRCLLPADGYYEWPGSDPHAFPEMYALRGERVFMFAGIWSNWQEPTAPSSFRTCALLLTEPNDLVSPTHKSMPAILRKEHVAAWLDPQTPLRDLTKFLQPFPSEEMSRRIVSCRINRP